MVGEKAMLVVQTFLCVEGTDHNDVPRTGLEVGPLHAHAVGGECFGVAQKPHEGSPEVRDVVVLVMVFGRWFETVMVLKRKGE